MRYTDFAVCATDADFSTKTITINANFIVDKTTVNTDTVKFFIVKDGVNTPFDECSISCDGKDILIVLNEYPDEGEEYYLYMKGVRDRLGRELHEPYMKSIVFSPNIATKLLIQMPEDQAVFKTKKVHVEVTILDDDNYTLKMIDDSGDSFDVVTFSESEDKPFDLTVDEAIEIVKQSSLEEVLELSSNTVCLQVSPEKNFYRVENITFNEHDSVSTSVYKIRADGVARIGNTLSFDLHVDADRQYFIRARLQSREDEHIFGPWSDCINFTVKSEALTSSTEDYLDEMLFSEYVFEDEYEPIEEVSKTDMACTDQEFYIEFNKTLLILDEMERTEDGLVLIGKGHLIRRDF